MTTATATAKADPTTELEAAQRELEEARQRRARLGVESRAFGTELAKAEAELGHLARTDPAQFGPDGQPKAKARAHELRAKLDQAGSTRWPDVLAGADQRVRQHEAEVRRLTGQHAVELAQREYRAGEDELAQVDELAERMLAVLASLDTRRTTLMAIAASCRGRIDGRDTLSDDRLGQLRQLLTEHASFQPPRSRILTPLVGEEPRVVRGRDGGWLGTQHGSDQYDDEDQPPKLEPRR